MGKETKPEENGSRYYTKSRNDLVYKAKAIKQKLRITSLQPQIIV
jgi:hypothetical protein